MAQTLAKPFHIFIEIEAFIFIFMSGYMVQACRHDNLYIGYVVIFYCAYLYFCVISKRFIKADCTYMWPCCMWLCWLIYGSIFSGVFYSSFIANLIQTILVISAFVITFLPKYYMDKRYTLLVVALYVLALFFPTRNSIVTEVTTMVLVTKMLMICGLFHMQVIESIDTTKGLNYSQIQFAILRTLWILLINSYFLPIYFMQFIPIFIVIYKPHYSSYIKNEVSSTMIGVDMIEDKDIEENTSGSDEINIGDINQRHSIRVLHSMT